MSAPTAYEQYMLELINAERAQVGIQPLMFNTDLNEAAETHSRWMIETDTFSHTGSGGSSAYQRMSEAGYNFTGTWSSGENIAWVSTHTPVDYKDEVELLHANLMNSPGHRANILNVGFTEIGIDFEIGEYKGYTAAFITQNFANTSLPTAKVPNAAGEDSLSDSSTTSHILVGGNGKDKLVGTSGDDKLSGKLSNDVLVGGAGRDIFVFDTKLNSKSNRDTVKDFNVKYDSFFLDNKYMKKLGYGSESNPEKIDKSYFKVGSKADDKNDYIIYNKETGVLFYDADGSSSKAAIGIAVLKKGLKLTYNDFFVI